jgi:type I restriction enzyme S subunit
MTQSTPNGWTIAKLGDIGDALIGLTYDPSAVRRSGTLVLRSSNVQNGRLNFEDNVYVACSIPERLRVRDQDILICVRNGSRRLIGKSAMLDHRVVGETFGAFMTVFRSDTNPYLRYFFQSGAFKRQIDEHLGATINQITNGSLKSFAVALPDEPERAAIAERLSDADAVIVKLEQLIAKRETIKQGMIQQLLSGKIRLPGFAGNWNSEMLGDVAVVDPETLASGTSPKEILDYISLEDVSRGSLLSSSRVRFIDAPSRARRVVREKDVLFGTVRPNLQSHVLYRHGLKRPIASTGFAVIRAVPDRTDPTFLFYFLMSRLARVQIDRIIAGSNYPAVSSADVRCLRLDLPNVLEQAAIGLVLGECDRAMSRLRVRLDKARAIKQGMMQELLSGHTRLPVLEATA